MARSPDRGELELFIPYADNDIYSYKGYPGLPTEDEDDISALAGEIFTCFSQLPIELRFRIWKLSCITRRVDLNLDRYVLKHFSKPTPEARWRFKGYVHRERWLQEGSSHIPAISRVCRESRQIFWEEYYPFRTERSGKESQLYINPRVDIILIRRWQDDDVLDLYVKALEKFLEEAPKKERYRVRHLAVSTSVMWGLARKPSDIEVITDRFPDLQELSLILENDETLPILAIEPGDPSSKIQNLKKVLEVKGRALAAHLYRKFSIDWLMYGPWDGFGTRFSQEIRQLWLDTKREEGSELVLTPLSDICV